MSRIANKTNDLPQAPHVATQAPAAAQPVGGIFRTELEPGSARFGALQLRLDAGPNGRAPRIVDAVLPRNGTWEGLGGRSPTLPAARAPATHVFEPHHQAAIVALTATALGSLVTLRLFGARVGLLPAAYAMVLAAAGLQQRFQFAQLLVVAAATGVAGANWRAALANPDHAGPVHILLALLSQGLFVASVRALFDAVDPHAPAAPVVDGLQFEPPLRITYGETDEGQAPLVAHLDSVRRMNANGRLAAEGSLDVRIGGATLRLDAAYLNALAGVAQNPWLTNLLPSAWSDAAAQVRSLGNLLAPENQRLAIEDAFGVAPAQAAPWGLSFASLSQGLSGHLSTTFGGVKVQGNARIAPVAPFSAGPSEAPASKAEAAASASAADAGARAAFNVLLDRSRVTAKMKLLPGTHTAAGLGIQAGYTPRITVQPGTEATLKTGRIDQVPGTAPTQSSLFARLGAAIGAVIAALWNAVCWLFGRRTTPKASAKAPVSLEPTQPAAALYAHDAELSLNKPVDVRLSNWTQNILSVRLNGAHLDGVGGLTPRGNVRLFGVPLLSLNRNWVRNALFNRGLQLSTDPYRILYGAEILAEPKLAPGEKPVPKPVDAERSAAAQGLLGEMLGAIDATVVREDLAAPRFVQTRSQGGDDFRLQLLATAEPVRLHYDLHQFKEPIEVRLRQLTLGATVQREGAASALQPLRIELPELVARGFWANPLDPTHWLSADVGALRLAQGSGEKATPLMQLTDVAWRRNTAENAFHAQLDWVPGGHKTLAAWLGSLGSNVVTPSVVGGLGLLRSTRYAQNLPRQLATVPFVPGPPKAAPAAPTGAAPAPEAVDVDDLDGSTLAGTPPRSRASSVGDAPTLGRTGDASWASSTETLVELKD